MNCVIFIVFGGSVTAGAAHDHVACSFQPSVYNVLKTGEVHSLSIKTISVCELYSDSASTSNEVKLCQTLGSWKLYFLSDNFYDSIVIVVSCRPLTENNILSGSFKHYLVRFVHIEFYSERKNVIISNLALQIISP